MGTQIKVWQLSQGKLVEIEETELADSYYEKDLEDWIERDTSLLGDKLLVIGRQYDVSNVGRIDLLAIDENGVLVLIEFKRKATSREAVAQILEYGSWLDNATVEEIELCAQEHLEKPIYESFSEFFGSDLQSLTPQNHRMLLVAPRLDVSAERIINYLAERSGLKINAIFFRFAKTGGGDEVLVRTVLVPEAPARAVHKVAVPLAELLATAQKVGVSPLVDACRKMASFVDDERSRRTYGGSLRYWLNGRMIFGVNVAGGRRKPPIGELDVWIPTARFGEVTGVDEQTVRGQLKSEFAAVESGASDLVIRLKTVDRAQELVRQLQHWIRPAHSG